MNINTKNLILFIHGFKGSPSKTWGNFPELCRKNPLINDNFEIGFYTYPTRIISIPFFRKVPSIQSLAQGLYTEIENRYSGYNQIILVCHSMGGVIARKYLVEQMKDTHKIQKNRIKKILLYAVPNLGADIAKLASLLHIRNKQIQQLTQDSEFLDSLNNDWDTLEISKKIDVKYIVGSLDSTVRRSSAQFKWGSDFFEIADKNHQNIVKPNNQEDLSFIIFNKFIQSERKKNKAKPQIRSNENSEQSAILVNIQDFINTNFSNNDLNLFIKSYYPDIYVKFFPGMEFIEKLTLLVDNIETKKDENTLMKSIRIFDPKLFKSKWH